MMTDVRPLRTNGQPWASQPRGLRLDAIHLRILRILERDGRRPVSEIAREVGLTDNAVRYRLKKLADAGVVRKYTVHVDPVRLGRSVSAFVLVKMAPGGDVGVLQGMRGVAFAIPTTGPYQAAMLVVADDATGLQNFLVGLRQQGLPIEEVQVLHVDPSADLPVAPSVCTDAGPRLD